MPIAAALMATTAAQPDEVIGSALVLLGHDPDTVVDWLHRVQRTRGRRGWPEQRWQAEVVLRSPGPSHECESGGS